MENSLLIITAVVLVIILTISIYFLLTKNKVKETKAHSEPIIEDNHEAITPEIEIKIPKNENFEVIIDKEVEKITEKSIVEEEETIKIIKKETKNVSKKSDKSNNDIDLPKLNINISSKTEKNLLKKIEAFENSKDFLKKDVNLNNLAKQFDTNTKYLSEIIKSYKNKNFNQYLNELRINHLIHQLNTNEKVLNTKVSYLASDFGFNSHSSFSTLFTQYIGQSPSEYIKALKEAKKENKTE